MFGTAPTKALSAFLVSRFSDSELREFIQQHYQSLEHDLPARGSLASPRELVGQTVALLDRHGLIGKTLFEALLAARRSLKEEIRQLEDSFARVSSDNRRPRRRAAGVVILGLLVVGSVPLWLWGRLDSGEIAPLELAEAPAASETRHEPARVIPDRTVSSRGTSAPGADTEPILPPRAEQTILDAIEKVTNDFKACEQGEAAVHDYTIDIAIGTNGRITNWKTSEPARELGEDFQKCMKLALHRVRFADGPAQRFVHARKVSGW